MTMLMCEASFAMPCIGAATAHWKQSPPPKPQQKARQHKPDAVILNMMMPDMDALRALRSLKADRATRSLPAVVVSRCRETLRGAIWP